MNYYEFSFTVGKLEVRNVRQFLERIHFNHPDITFLEEKDLLENTFTVNGPKTKLEALLAILKKYFEDE